MTVREPLRVRLDEQQVAFYRGQGYLGVDRITSAAELEWLAPLYESFFADADGQGVVEDPTDVFDAPGITRVRHGKFVEDYTEGALVQWRVEHPEHTQPRLLESECFQNGRRIASQVLGVEEGRLRFRGVMLLKPPGGALTGWHQHSAWVEPGQPVCEVSVWMPLDRATVEGSCMKFIPGSNLGPTVEHVNLVIPAVDEAQVVPVPLDAGGAVLIDGRVIHGAGPNQTGRPRRALIFQFQA